MSEHTTERTTERENAHSSTVHILISYLQYHVRTTPRIVLLVLFDAVEMKSGLYSRVSTHEDTQQHYDDDAKDNATTDRYVVT